MSQIIVIRSEDAIKNNGIKTIIIEDDGTKKFLDEDNLELYLDIEDGLWKRKKIEK